VSLGKDFRDFILRGNVVDLGVGIVIGAAFTAVVQSFTKDVITPLIGIPGKLSVGDISFSIHGSKFLIGDFINVVISFLLPALVVYFFVVRPVNYFMSRNKPNTPEPETTRECPECLSKIPIQATRCAYCTTVVQPQSASTLTTV
jgi:large conductance mechanosensitive channel